MTPMEEDRSTHYALVRVELEDVTPDMAGEFWSALHGHEIDIGGCVAVVVRVEPEPADAR